MFKPDSGGGIWDYDNNLFDMIARAKYEGNTYPKDDIGGMVAVAWTGTYAGGLGDDLPAGLRDGFDAALSQLLGPVLDGTGYTAAYADDIVAGDVTGRIQYRRPGWATSYGAKPAVQLQADTPAEYATTQCFSNTSVAADGDTLCICSRKHDCRTDIMLDTPGWYQINPAYFTPYIDDTGIYADSFSWSSLADAHSTADTAQPLGVTMLNRVSWSEKVFDGFASNYGFPCAGYYGDGKLIFGNPYSYAVFGRFWKLRIWDHVGAECGMCFLAPVPNTLTSRFEEVWDNG